MEATIRLAEDSTAMARCFAVMHALRPHLAEEDFVARIERQRAGGYRLAFLETGGAVRACAGFRVLESLWCGLFLYVDDLAAAPDARSLGHGGRLFDWLVEHARAQGCAELHLDSGVQRFAAHRFYLGKRMEITAHHFALKL